MNNEINKSIPKFDDLIDNQGLSADMKVNLSTSHYKDSGKVKSSNLSKPVIFPQLPKDAIANKQKVIDNEVGKNDADIIINKQPQTTNKQGVQIAPCLSDLLFNLSERCVNVDFHQLAKKDKGDPLQEYEYIGLVVKSVLLLADKADYGFESHSGKIYFYNGVFWESVEPNHLEKFLQDCAQRLGIEELKVMSPRYSETLLKTFVKKVPAFKLQKDSQTLCINLQNGTLKINPFERIIKLHEFNKDDYLTYQLPFAFNPDTKCTKFQSLLDKVLPDKSAQMVIAEFVASVFIPNSVCKFEKMLMLYGQGANGKSVLYKVITALLGENNVSHASITQLTESNGYYRAQIVDKLLNYSSELGTEFESAIFKQMVSGESITARSPHVPPFTFVCKTKFIVNANVFPNIKEHTDAVYRRFIIIPFEVQIPESEQIKDLDTQIITTELSGVLNWVLEGLNRLLTNRQFTECESAKRTLDRFRKDSDTVLLFLEDNHYIKSDKKPVALTKELYADYKQWCSECGYRFPLGLHKFSERLRNAGIEVKRSNKSYVVLLTKNESTTDES